MLLSLCTPLLRAQRFDTIYAITAEDEQGIGDYHRSGFVRIFVGYEVLSVCALL